MKFKADFQGFSKKYKTWQSRFPYLDENTTSLIINELWLFWLKISKSACKRKKKKKSNIKEKEERKGPTKGEMAHYRSTKKQTSLNSLLIKFK